MTIEELRKYRLLYKSSAVLGSARILRDFLGLEPGFPIPLSLSHGVDMNHRSGAMDVHSIEPIHWSCNEIVHERALGVKPSVRLPHPWLMLKSKRPASSGAGILIVGPPPGRSNDEALFRRLRELSIGPYDLLLKARGEIDSSREFWESKGVKVVTAGARDDFFYDRLYDTLQRYDEVLGCNVSSALFFAAAIDKKVGVVPDYTYTVYETLDYLDGSNYGSPIAMEFVRHLVNKNHKSAAMLAAQVLGADFLQGKEEGKAELITAMERLTAPVHYSDRKNSLGRAVVLELSSRFGKVALVQEGVRGYLSRRLRDKVCIISINEVDAYTQGITSSNFHLTEIPYTKNITEPGWAVD